MYLVLMLEKLEYLIKNHNNYYVVNTDNDLNILKIQNIPKTIYDHIVEDSIVNKQVRDYLLCITS